MGGGATAPQGLAGRKARFGEGGREELGGVAGAALTSCGGKLQDPPLHKGTPSPSSLLRDLIVS